MFAVGWIFSTYCFAWRLWTIKCIFLYVQGTLSHSGRTQHDAYFGIDGKRGRRIRLVYGMGCLDLDKAQRHKWRLGSGLSRGMQGKTDGWERRRHGDREGRI